MLTFTCRAAVTFSLVVLVAPAGALADTYDPPPWFRDTAALIDARGGTCTAVDKTQSPLHPRGARLHRR
jgi:hypothetical protein